MENQAKFDVVLGQDGDDFVGGQGENLAAAMKVAGDFANEINKRPTSGGTTYIYILTPDKERVNYPLHTPSK